MAGNHSFLGGLGRKADHIVGDGLERAVSNHHRRRLRKLGWERALDASPGDWADGHPPPREGSSVTVLIDGADAFQKMADAIRSARSHVHLGGWHLTADFKLGESSPLLSELLAECARAVDVRVLLWGGIPLPHPIRPNRTEVRGQGEHFTGARIKFAVDTRHRPLHCHHEKILIVDDDVAFVGGIDFTRLSGDRLDSPEHPHRAGIGWHDVATLLRGPIVRDVAEHFCMRWKEVAGTTLSPPMTREPSGESTVQLVRTVPEKLYSALPGGDFRILEVYMRALRSAKRFIYIENQFLWSPDIVGVLKEKLLHPPTPGFRLVVLLPSKPSTGGDDTKGQLGVLAEADDHDGRFFACTLFARSGAEAQPIYVHSKTTIIDDRWMTIGSANLNNHSLYNDTEVNVVTDDAALARETRLRLWSEHLEAPIDEVDGDPLDVIESHWKPIGNEQLERRLDGQPLTHRLVMLPNVSKRAGRVLGPLQSIIVDG